jgi:hypothetical protein
MPNGSRDGRTGYTHWLVRRGRNRSLYRRHLPLFLSQLAQIALFMNRLSGLVGLSGPEGHRLTAL